MHNNDKGKCNRFIISITKTLSIPCCSTLFSRFLCHHFTTVKCCQTSSECRCDHGFSLQEHLRILASSIACYLRLSVCQKYPWRGIVGHKLYMFTIDFNHAKLKLQKDSLWQGMTVFGHNKETVQFKSVSSIQY